MSDNEGYLDKESNSFDNILTYGNITVKPNQIYSNYIIILINTLYINTIE